MIKSASFLFAAVFALISVSAHAETLDDASIRKVYAASQQAMGAPDTARKDMELRMDANSRIRFNVSVNMNGLPLPSIDKEYNKQEAIAENLRGMQNMTRESFEYTILDIKYSDDKKYAYVQDRITSYGTMRSKLPNGKPLVSKTATAAACADTLSLVGGVIKIMQSSCNVVMQVQPQLSNLVPSGLSTGDTMSKSDFRAP